MYTSDEYKKILRKNLLGFALAAAFFAFFGWVYEKFSHEVYSNYMIYAFLIPLILGVGVWLIPAITKRELPAAPVRQLYGGGVMMLTAGSIVKGVLDIYGTSNQKIVLYPVLGIGMIAVAVTADFIRRKKQKRNRQNLSEGEEVL